MNSLIYTTSVYFWVKKDADYGAEIIAYCADFKEYYR